MAEKEEPTVLTKEMVAEMYAKALAEQKALVAEKKKAAEEAAKSRPLAQPGSGFRQPVTAEARAEANGEKYVWIDTDLPKDFPKDKHPFQPATPERMESLKESIRENGIISPIILWGQIDGRYTILSGHNRRAAARSLGMPNIPCIVKRGISEQEAQMIMLDSNLQDRENLLPSEKAFAYKMRLEGMRRTAGRPSTGNSAQGVLNFGGKQSRDILGEQVGESHEQVRRYIRLTSLIPELLAKVDEKALGFVNGVQLSYISRVGQQVIYEYFFVDKPRGKLDGKLIQYLRELDADPDRALLPADIDAFFLQQEASRAFRVARVPMQNIRQYFPDATEKQVVDRIVELIHAYYTHH